MGLPILSIDESPYSNIMAGWGFEGAQTMISITAAAFQQDIYQFIEKVNADNAPITITNRKGRDAVLIGEDEWTAIEKRLGISMHSMPASSISCTPS